MDRLVYERMSEQEATHWWFAARRDIISQTIRKFSRLTDEARLLEAGCGTGGNLQMLSQFGNLDAFEFDLSARECAESKSGMSVPFGALPDQLPHGDKRYHLIGLFDVLEHIEDDVGSLASLAARLEPEGRILVTVPAFNWLWSRHDERHHHFRRYTRKSLRKTAEEAGLDVVYSFYFNALLLPVAIATRALKTVLRSDNPDDVMPSPWLNKALYRVFSSERHLVGTMRMPVGLSVCAVLTKASR